MDCAAQKRTNYALFAPSGVGFPIYLSQTKEMKQIAQINKEKLDTLVHDTHSLDKIRSDLMPADDSRAYRSKDPAQCIGHILVTGDDERSIKLITYYKSKMKGETTFTVHDPVTCTESKGVRLVSQKRKSKEGNGARKQKSHLSDFKTHRGRLVL